MKYKNHRRAAKQFPDILFAADKEYVLSRDKVKDRKRGEIFKAILKARHIFEQSGELVVACRVQDNLAGEMIFSKKIQI